jgi:arylsulfatase A-like enzyme
MRQPNIVFILTDDLGIRDLGCTGSTFYETPRLDALAAAGATCVQGYATCPVCSPSRASLLCGRSPARLGLTNYIPGQRVGRLCEAPFLHHLPRSETTVATALRAGGYQTWHVGKWHLGDGDCLPQHQGFDVNVGGCHWGMPHRGYWAPWGIPGLPEAADGTYLTDHLTDRSLDLIRGRDQSRPFFLNLCHYAVHTPIQAPAALVERFRAKAAALGLDRVPAIVAGEEMPVLPGDPNRPMQRVQRRVIQSDPVYAAMLANLDANIGRLVDALAADGLLDNTLLVFTSDNGGLSTAEGSPTCNLPHREGKGWDTEGGVRVPWLWHWPGVIPAGSTPRPPVQGCDLFPTLLAAAGLPLRPDLHCDGVDLLPLLAHGTPPPERTLFWHFPHYGNQGGQPAAWALRDGWKLVHRYEAGADLLFHLPSDPGELHDRAGDAVGIRDRLRAELDAWQVAVAARHPTPNPDWERLRALVPQHHEDGAL